MGRGRLLINRYGLKQLAVGWSWGGERGWLVRAGWSETADRTVGLGGGGGVVMKQYGGWQLGSQTMKQNSAVCARS